MLVYIVTITNESGAEIYRELIHATSENDAIVKVLKNVIINSGDTIKIMDAISQLLD